jgi:DNA-binding NarL/FixJ family response regulator
MPAPETSREDPAAGPSAPEPAELPGQIAVLIADDQTLVRAGFRAILEAQPGIRVVGEAIDGRNAVDLARRRRPDVVLMDIRMPDLDGLEPTRRIVAEAGEHAIAVLMLTTFDLNEYVYDALRAGASGFLLKDVLPEDLIAAVRVVAAGDGLIARGLSNGEIAEELVLSEATVKTHVKRVLSKLGLRDRVQAVVLAYEAGLVTPGDRSQPQAATPRPPTGL